MCLYRGGGEQAWLAPVRGLPDGFSWISRDLGVFRSAQCSGPVFVPDEGGGDGGLASDTHIVVHRVMSSPNMWLKWLGQSGPRRKMPNV